MQDHVDGKAEGLPRPLCPVAEKKARLVAFAAEHSLPFSIVPDLDLCKVMSDNKSKVLSKIHMSKQCVTYTTTHGLAVALKEDLIVGTPK